MTAQGQPKPEGSLSNLDKLCTVNQISERAKLIVGRLVDDLKETYTIDHVANSPNIDGLRAMVEQHRLDLLFTALMCTPEEAKEIVAIAKDIVPDVRTMSIPKGLQAETERVTNAVVEYAKGCLPTILDQAGRANCASATKQ